MTLNTTYNPTVADGNGTTKEFSYNFNPLAREYLKVSFQINNEWVEQKSGWSATVSENGGVVTFDIAPTTRVAIERNVPEEQPTQYKTSSGFQAEVIEHSFDLLTGMVQELKDETSRSVKVEVGSNISPDEIVSQVERVYNSIDNIDTVVMDIDNVDEVATSISKVNTIANNINDVKTVADNINDVKTVSKNIENVNTVATDIMDVVTVAGITEQTKNVSDNMTAVVDVSNNKTKINNVSANIAAVNNVSKNMADVKKAVQSANDAKLWAVGTKTEKPEGSSKYWAEQAQQAAQVYDATETVKGIVRLATSDEVTAGTNDSAAITPLKLKSKLDTKQDKSTAINYNNISNCITEIPQDIKLELINNNTIVLKKGSIVYIPNSTENFDKVTITKDVSDGADSNRETLLFYKVKHEKLESMPVEFCFSSSTAPTNFYSGKYAVWYDTENNVIKLTKNGGTNWDSGYSFPICLAHETTTTYSISQVFNGFGYIGSTVYALPGVKGLIPNSRNADGSLKNIEFVNDRVKIFTASGSGYGLTYFLTPDYVRNLAAVNTKAYAEKDTKLTTFDNNYGIWFDTKQNIMLQTTNSGATWTRVNYVSFSYMFKTNADHLDYLVSKTVFHALDYNESSRIVSIMDNKVNKSGDTMTGTLTINQNDLLLIKSSGGKTIYKNPTRESSTIPSNVGGYGFNLFWDKNNVEVGRLESWQNTDGGNHTLIRARCNNIEAQIRVGIDGTNIPYTEAPKCNWNNSIVTTVSHNNNYVRFGNGLQICWGSVTVGDGATVYQNLPQAFKDTNYIVTFGHQNFTDSSTDFYHPQLVNGKKNTTNFTVYCRNAGSYHNAAVTWIAIGYWY